MTARKGRQCKACPWKKSTVPGRDIPGGYSVEKHRALRNTIAEPGMISPRALRVFTCHEAQAGEERPCVGWVIHQLGPGNNIAVRMKALDGRVRDFRPVGPQHATFAATLGDEDDGGIDWGDEGR